MSPTKDLVVELGKLAGVLAAAGDRLLNALVPSPSATQRRVGQCLTTLEPMVCNGYSPADILNRMTAEAAQDGLYERVDGFVDTRESTVPPFDSGSTGPDGVGGPVVPAQEVPGASPNTTGPTESVSDWIGLYDCPCGGAYEVFEDSTLDNVAGLKTWFDQHQYCGRDPIPDGPPVIPGIECVFPSGQPVDDFPEPLGEYPDIDPRAVITGGRRDWSGVGVPPSDQKLLPPELRVRVNPVPSKSSASHSPLPADTAPSPSEPASAGGSGHPNDVTFWPASATRIVVGGDNPTADAHLNLKDAVARVLFEVWIGDTTLWPKLPERRRDAWRPYAAAVLERFNVTPK